MKTNRASINHFPVRGSAVSSILFAVAVFLLMIFFSGAPADAHQVDIYVGPGYARPAEFHIFSGDWVTFQNESESTLTLSFGKNCVADAENNTQYGFPVALVPVSEETLDVYSSWGITITETDGTVLYVSVSDGSECAVIKITVHGIEENFEAVIPKGSTVHTSDLGGESLVLKSLAIFGTLVLDGDTTIRVTGKGMPSDELEVFKIGPVASIEGTPDTNGTDGYSLRITVTGITSMNNPSIDLSGTAGSMGETGANGVAVSCSTVRTSYLSGCTGSCVYYDDDECLTGCTACDSGWQSPDDCDADCKCCYDQALVTGANGSNGSDGQKGGNGGSFILSQTGDFYGGVVVTTNGAQGGLAGNGGDGASGCNSWKCNETQATGMHGIGGTPGNAGLGGNGGAVTITVGDCPLSGWAYVNITSNGGTGGTGGLSGSSGSGESANTTYSNGAGAKGGNGGKVVINTGCSGVRGYIKSKGGVGGVSPTQNSGYDPLKGGTGGAGGQVIVNAALINLFGTTSAVGGDGGKGAGYGATDVGGFGGRGGRGGTVSLKSVSNTATVLVTGGAGGTGTNCGATSCTGAAGADGTYTDGAGSTADLTVDLAADGDTSPGQVLEYTVLINSGSHTSMTGVTASVPIPTGTSFLGASGTHSVSNDVVTWQVGDMEPCQGATFSFTVQVDSDLAAGSVISTHATAASTEGYTATSETVETTLSEEDENWVDLQSIFGNGTNQALITEPVNPAIGNYVYTRELFQFPGKGLPVRFITTYNSLDASSSGPLGAGWTHTFNVSLSIDADSVVTVLWGDGHREFFQRGDSSYVPVKCVTDVVMNSIETGGYQAKLADGTRYLFSLGGNLQSIQDLNGNTITLHYDDATYPDRVTSVVDTAGRTITFTYSGGLITRITAPLTKVRFTYDSSGNLRSIIDGRGTTRRFTYNASHYLTRVAIKGSSEGSYQNLVTNAYNARGKILRQQNALGETTTYDYADTSTGSTTTITPPSGNAVVHAFDKNYNLVKTTDGEGYQTSFTYDASGRCVGATDKNGATITKSYDSSGNPLELTNRMGGTTKATYDSENRATTITDPLGNLMAASYDGNGNQTAVTDQLDRSAKFNYGGTGQPTLVTHPDGLRVSMLYTGTGLPHTVKDSAGNSSRFQYDAAGRPVVLQDADGTARITLTYDENGNPVTVTDPMGSVTTLAYDRSDNLVERTFGPLSATFEYEYDLLGRVTKITDPIKGETSYGYDSDGNAVSITDQDGVTTRFEYDKANRLTTVTYPDGSTTGYEHDANGNPTSMTDPFGKVWGFAYDAEGRLTVATDPSGKQTTRAYDAEGRPVTLTDALGRVTSFEYDASGLLVTKLFPNGKKLSFTHNTSGNPVRVTNEANRSWTFGYDKPERVTKTTDPLGRVTAFAYDDFGRLVKKTDGTGAATSYTYDLNSRVTRITLPDSSTLDFAYDAEGRILSTEGPSGTVTRTYDKMGRLRTITDENDLTLTYTYTAAGRVKTVTYPGSKVVTYGYDSAGRLSTVTDWAGHVTTYHYDTMARVSMIDLSNGTSSRRTYDDNGRLTGIRHLDGSNTVFCGATITYDDAGQIVKETRTTPVATPAFSAGKDRYSFDRSNQLASGTVGGEATVFGFDDNGNMVSKSVGSVVTTYGYDAMNRLVSVQGPAGTTSYSYDNFGNRSAKTHNGVETRYLTGGNVPYMTYPASGGTRSYHIYGGVLLYSLDDSGAMQVYHTDERGSVVGITDASATLVQGYSYDPFGQVLAGSGEIANPFGFLGLSGVFTDENGLCFMNARYYDPAVMRFLTEDPAGIAAGLNRYLYAGDNPVSKADPSGLSPDALGQTTASETATTTTESDDASIIPDWATPVNLGLNYVGLTQDYAEAKAVSSALRKYDVIITKEKGTTYILPKDTLNGNLIPLKKFAPAGKKIIGWVGEGMSLIDHGLSVVTANGANVKYRKTHTKGHFWRDVWNADPDALDCVHENAMVVNSFLGRHPYAKVMTAEMSTVDYLMDEYGNDAVEWDASHGAEYSYLEMKARFEGRQRGLKMRDEFNSELKQLKADLKELHRSWHGDGLNGCKTP